MENKRCSLFSVSATWSFSNCMFLYSPWYQVECISPCNGPPQLSACDRYRALTTLISRTKKRPSRGSCLYAEDTVLSAPNSWFLSHKFGQFCFLAFDYPTTFSVFAQYSSSIAPLHSFLWTRRSRPLSLRSFLTMGIHVSLFPRPFFPPVSHVVPKDCLTILSSGYLYMCPRSLRRLLSIRSGRSPHFKASNITSFQNTAYFIQTQHPKFFTKHQVLEKILYLNIKRLS